MEYRSRGVEETEALGERLGARLCPGDVVACRGIDTPSVSPPCL